MAGRRVRDAAQAVAALADFQAPPRQALDGGRRVIQRAEARQILRAVLRDPFDRAGKATIAQQALALVRMRPAAGEAADGIETGRGGGRAQQAGARGLATQQMRPRRRVPVRRVVEGEAVRHACLHPLKSMPKSKPQRVRTCATCPRHARGWSW